jgi:hypothetical protein
MLRNLVIGIAMIVAGITFSHFGRGTQDKPAEIPAAAPGQSETAPGQISENLVAYNTGYAAMNGLLPLL